MTEECQPTAAEQDNYPLVSTRGSGSATELYDGRHEFSIATRCITDPYRFGLVPVVTFRRPDPATGQKPSISSSNKSRPMPASRRKRQPPARPLTSADAAEAIGSPPPDAADAAAREGSMSTSASSACLSMVTRSRGARRQQQHANNNKAPEPRVASPVPACVLLRLCL